MLKNVSKLILVAFPLGLIGSIANAYTLKLSNDTKFQDIGVWEGLLIGSVTMVTFLGFLIYVHFKLFAVPQDLFTGPLFVKTGTYPMFGGSPAIFRQAIATGLCMWGSGIGCISSALLFGVDTLGIGISMFLPGLAVTVLLVALWKSKYVTREKGQACFLRSLPGSRSFDNSSIPLRCAQNDVLPPTALPSCKGSG